jgi:hypothetical protein
VSFEIAPELQEPKIGTAAVELGAAENLPWDGSDRLPNLVEKRVPEQVEKPELPRLRIPALC